MDIIENEEQIEEEMEQLPPDSADLAALDTEEPVETEQEELAAAETEEPVAVEADEPVEAEQAELEESVTAETEEVVEAELEEPVMAETEEVIEAELEEPAAAKTEEPAAVETDEPVEAEQAELEEPVMAETEEVIEAELDEPVDGEAEKPAAAEQEEPVQDESELSADYSVLHEPVKDDGRAWYVVHCYSGNEDKVRHNILQRIESMGVDDLIFDVVVPTEDEVNNYKSEESSIESRGSSKGAPRLQPTDNLTARSSSRTLKPKPKLSRWNSSVTPLSTGLFSASAGLLI